MIQLRDDAAGFDTVFAVEGGRGMLAVDATSHSTILVQGSILDRNATYHVRAFLFEARLLAGETRDAFLTERISADIVYGNSSLQQAREVDLPDHIVEMIAAAALSGAKAKRARQEREADAGSAS